MSKIIEMTDLQLKNIENLENEEKITVQLPFDGIKLTIERQSEIMPVLGVPTTMYTDKFVIHDNDGRLFLKHDVALSAEDMLEYVATLKETRNKKEFHYARKLKEKGLKAGTKIEFKDGKQALIAPLSEDCPPTHRALFYIPLKKDGSISKVKPRILYGGTEYKVVE